MTEEVLMIKIKTDTEDRVTQWAYGNRLRKVGEITEDGYTIYQLTKDQLKSLVPDHSSIVEGVPVLDDDYDPDEEMKRLMAISNVPTESDITTAGLLLDVAELKCQIKSLTENK